MSLELCWTLIQTIMLKSYFYPLAAEVFSGFSYQWITLKRLVDGRVIGEVL